MAQKKENKMIGYLVIAVIPLIGIAWAGVEGILHSNYVKDAIQAEEEFEKHFVEKLNSIVPQDVQTLKNNMDAEDLEELTFPTLTEVDIVSVIPYPYSAKLDADPFESSATVKSSYSIRIGANLITPSVDNAKPVYQIEYEFLVSSEIYTDFTNNYDMDYIATYGEKEYIYETYYVDNPRNSPIYKLQQHFDDNYLNLLSYKYIDQTNADASLDVNLSGPFAIINLINSIDVVTLEDKEIFDKINAIYSGLSADEKAQIPEEDWNKYLAYVEEYEVLDMIHVIDELPSVEELIADYNTNSMYVDNANKAYAKLDENQKALITNYATLELLTANLPLSKFYNYFNLLQTEDGYKDSRVKLAVDTFNKDLTVAQKQTLSDEQYALLQEFVNKYNEGKADNKKLTLETREQE